MKQEDMIKNSNIYLYAGGNDFLKAKHLYNKGQPITDCSYRQYKHVRCLIDIKLVNSWNSWSQCSNSLIFTKQNKKHKYGKLQYVLPFCDINIVAHLFRDFDNTKN